MAYQTIIEPFRIKVAEPITMLTREERKPILKMASYNLFQVLAKDVTIDLLTDSGTGAMSAKQWADIMQGDESYAGSRSFVRFERVAKELTGLKHIIPTHQGRAAERILFDVVGGKGRIIPNNTHFDTTRANVENSGAKAIDLPCEESKDVESMDPFKGNMNLEALRNTIQEYGPKRIPIVFMTITNNTLGGQPVSLANIKEAYAICQENKIPFFLDACRFAENAYFIKMREGGYKDKSVSEIVSEIFSYCDGCTLSAKKDGLVNTGGFLAMNCDEWAEKALNLLILTEGFPTYGGLAGRDLEAMAQGLQEVLDEDYLHYRYRSTFYLGEHLKEKKVPILNPVGGHAVFIDASRFCEHIPRNQFPGQALICDLYLEGGIRGVEVGSLMFPENGNDRHELVRLAIPRRVYTQSHIDYVIEVILKVFENRKKLKGLRLIYEAPYLRHFTAKLEPIS